MAKKMPVDIAGLSQLMKEGTRHFRGVEDATVRNIRACQELSEVVRTSLGPNGRNKMVINHLEKLAVTSDAAAILKELEVEHPAANMIVMASKQQEAECGDFTNFVIVFAGELLSLAEGLLRMGLHISDIIAGYEAAGKKALEVIEQTVVDKCDDITDKVKVSRAINSSIAAKQYGWEHILSPLIAEACITVLSSKEKKSFNVDSVRVCKVLGASVADSFLLKGFALPKNVAGSINRVKNPRIAVLASGLDIEKPETKGTVLITDAQELKDFAKGEENQIKQVVDELSAAKIDVVVSGGAISDIALHFLERAKIMVIKESSKFNLRRICRAIGAVPLVRLGAPTAEEVGTCDEVAVEEVGSTKVLFFRCNEKKTGIATIVIRGSTDNILDDIERSIDDGVNSYKVLLKDNRLTPGAGAVEMELAKLLGPFGDSTPGMEQYAIKKFIEALQVIPRTLAENSGLNSTATLSSLQAAHESGNKKAGIDINGGELIDALEKNILDLYSSKASAIKLATVVAVSILRVDQIIMAKRAGGPKVPEMGSRDVD